ncbi:LOW QUALITY PROTEIN: coiled-coil domain-containing protein 122 [Erythrolamprus reginae]|uniref:LOW QUALITY PROTEIN: coiled-coil domain-containing protein 122 n=1 Tax=Erythrolamprus reginae TaxID=121349 RepID=UPI00396CB943
MGFPLPKPQGSNPRPSTPRPGGWRGSTEALTEEKDAAAKSLRTKHVYLEKVPWSSTGLLSWKEVSPGMSASDSLGIAEMVKRVAEQQNTQACEIQKSKEVLTQMQAQLRDLELQRNSVVAERKAVERQRYFSEEALAATRGHLGDLEAQISASHSENVKLAQEVEVLQEELERKILRNRAYYEKMAAHRNWFKEAESKLPFVVELVRKRAAVQQLREKKEELVASLRAREEQDMTGQVQDEISCLQSEMKVLKEAINEEENAIRNEKSRHATLQKEIELQRKRSVAVLKRLRCQVNNLELERRLGHSKLQQLEGEAGELRKLLQAANE